MQRLLVISDAAKELSWLWESPSLHNCEIETVGEEADVLQLLRRRDFDIVLTSPTTPMKSDLAQLSEMLRIRPGLRLILLAPETTPKDLITALRAHVFACFSAPYKISEVMAMIDRAIEECDWKDGIEVLSASSDWIAFRITPRRLSAERLVRFMTELRSDLPDPEREALITAFREILLNAIEHGAGFESDLTVEVAALRTQRAIVYYFRDPGPGFNRDRLPHAAGSNPLENPIGHIEYRDAHGMRSGGFGIMISKQLVDEVIYNEIGNEVLLIKHICRRLFLDEKRRRRLRSDVENAFLFQPLVNYCTLEFNKPLSATRSCEPQMNVYSAPTMEVVRLSSLFPFSTHFISAKFIAATPRPMLCRSGPAPAVRLAWSAPDSPRRRTDRDPHPAH